MNARNQIADSGFVYDAAGNLIAEPGKTYTYDAENRLLSVGGSTPGSYVYDAEGKRVQKTANGVTTEFIYDAAGNVAAEREGANWTVGYVYLGGLLAQYKNGTTHFVHKDHLGSTRLVTGVTQSVVDNMDFLPFGEQVAGATATTHKFTGKERDPESGLDNFGARYFGSTLGRFISPDDFWKDSSVRDPQSWNKYAYARNNPLRYVDPTGEKATVTTNCTTNDQNQTTCNVNIQASISVYATEGSNLTQEQLNAAASTIQSSIQDAWSGTFTQDGVTYNVSTQISVSVAASQQAAMESGAQNVIGLTDGPASASASSIVDNRSPFRSGPDTGTWNYRALSRDVAHEFSHLLGMQDSDSGASITNHLALSMGYGATSSDLRNALAGPIAEHGLQHGPQRAMGYPGPFRSRSGTSTSTLQMFWLNTHAPIHLAREWWK